MALATDKRLSLVDPVTSLTGVGVGLQERLARIGIHKIQDLLFHLPYRYIDQTHLTPIGTLRAGHDAYIQGNVEMTQIQYGRRRSLRCQISDGSGTVTLRFFYFSKAQISGLQQGALLRCYGQVRAGRDSLEITHPEYRLLNNNAEPVLAERLTPVYPSTDGLQQTRLRKLTDQGLKVLHDDQSSLTEVLPKEVLSAQNLPSLVAALEYVHRPPPDADVQSLIEVQHIAQQRLVLEELLAYRLGLLKVRDELRQQTSPALKIKQHLLNDYLERLPFTLTNAQKNAVEIIQQDLGKTQSMHRLIQGDVGCGKTVVAAVAALQAIGAGYQVAIMAPTELLAEQHYNYFLHSFEPLAIEVIFITGKLKKSVRDKTLARMNDERPVVVIGTHALFQQSVQFANLGLIIIDEQHRFGVKQRLTLLEKGGQLLPHQLVLTATPIPRTLAMTVYADLDHTIINELPPNRKTISTSVISNERRADIMMRIQHVCNEGRQVYWICPLIEESDTLQCETAIDTAEVLTQKLSPMSVGLVHGRMKADIKEAAMQSFKDRKISLLVATTVIEVGVDVPNASLMIIDNAERLGLSQLHQLRGRVGRSDLKSHCILMYQSPLTELARQRLEIMRTHSDGFVIAEKDFKLRGPGEVLGTRQAGMPSLRIANLVRDAYLLPTVQTIAKTLIKTYPGHAQQLIERWLGDKFDYRNV